jgi:putative ABC transport system substrate-binding protein
LQNVKTVAYLVDPDEPDTDYEISTVQEAARVTGLELRVLNVRTDAELEAAITGTQRDRSALMVANGGSFIRRRGLIIALAARHALPVFYNQREWPALGGLISYGASFTASYRQVGIYAGRVLKGANPADLPVIQPTKFELVINLNAAKALGLTVPPTLLALADEVIE